ncbi:hypothetical protein [Acinetobacter sp. ANC 4779]|uniref:hypothetical protein n=1 Tax=Acinetobacter sp. ANC 4779 TaxID=2529848 RepID=UPI001BC86AF4|nr:hypothetical protein [Acinetobacter sp. ANC 4779]
MFLSISLTFAVSIFSSMVSASEQVDAIQFSSNSEQEVAPCTNGFDDVNVCQLRS